MKKKYVTLNGEKINVQIKDIDTDNDIVFLVLETESELIPKDEKLIWAIQKVYEKDKSFTLYLETSIGVKDSLLFVRNL